MGYSRAIHHRNRDRVRAVEIAVFRQLVCCLISRKGWYVKHLLESERFMTKSTDLSGRERPAHWFSIPSQRVRIRKRAGERRVLCRSGPIYFRQDYLNAAAPAAATWPSCSPEPPDTPTAPTILPPTLMGAPPSIGMAPVRRKRRRPSPPAASAS